ncbi:glycoside hydrolase family 3 N-terminal domain-containing protein [Bacteroides sp. UBA939]|uniref:glycoside hydrolase family 3 N-terminal domain-containing protein n=1 Tax=Bacteroides sp. UBA939 TaxID=1946092 RepID=UPI0025B7BEE0|nr:glycoside hydrolase family 3 N-terminal domain-containing protein [Bacteroides sp. UBA939]
MKKTIYLFLILFLWSHISPLEAQVVPPFLPSADDVRCKQWVDSVFSRLTLQEKVGQLIVTTIPAKADKQRQKQIRELAKKYKIGGLLFAEGTIEEQAILTNLAQKNAKVPLLVTFDGEWGLSMRLDGTPHFPKNAALGCIQDNDLIYRYGFEVAREFRELGVHVNFAPDADVNTNPLNPVIHVRSFGEDPKKVAEKVLAYSRGLESGGVLSVSKHFPGHGDTDVDSHKALPVLYYNRERLDTVELYPFREAIRAGLGGIMVGHLQVPALEPDFRTASSLSGNIVTGLLKKEMGFRGLVFTDALDMKGVSSIPQVTTKALLAGNDMVLVQYNTANAVTEVLNAVKEGVLPESEVDAKCRKILTYKYLLGLRRPRPQLQVGGMSQRINTDGAQALVTELRRASVTVLGNYFGVLPLTPVGGAPIALLSVGEGKDSVFIREVRKYSPVPVECFRLNKETTADACRELARKLADYRRIVVSVSGKDADTAAYGDFLASLDFSVPLVYAFFTSYRGMQPLESALAKAAAIVLGHSPEADIQSYVAGVIFAKVPAQGKLSMSVGNLYKAGEGSVVTPDMKPGRIIPEDLGMSSYELRRIDAIALSGLHAKAYPGCQVLVLKEGLPVYDKCFGTHSGTDTTTVRSTDMFDLASLTKTTATLLAVMKLYDENKLKLTDKASQYLPFLRNTNKKNITIKELLLHESGLPPYIRFYLDAIDPNSVHGPYAQSWVDEWHRTQISEHSYYCSDFKFGKGLMSDKETSVHTLHVADKMWMNKSFKNTMMQKIAKCELGSKRYVYSDLGFILLQQIVESIVKQPMDYYLAKEFYTPMGLQRTMYLPLNKYPKEEIMPTAANDFLRRQDLCGYVHDETAACLGGISGNAGLFSTATEVARIYQMILNDGELDGKRYLNKATCQLFTTETSALGRRGLGYDKPELKDLKNSPCSASATAAVYGHTGSTGTCVWVDPEHKTIYVFLSNHLCPNAWSTKLGDMKIRTDIQEVIYKSLK